MNSKPAFAKTEKRRGAFRLLFFAQVAIGAGNTMLVTTVLPLMTRELDLPDWTAGAIFSLSAVGWVIFSAVWGAKSNEWGRRPVAAIGMFGFATSMILFGMSAVLGQTGVISGWGLLFALLLVSRSLFGILGSATPPAAQAYIADRTLPENRTDEIASLSSGFTFGAVLGPALAAGLIDRIGLLAPVFFAAIVALGFGIAIWFGLPEKREPYSKSVKTNEAKGLWRDSSVAPFLVYGVGLSLITGIMVQTFPFFMLDKLTASGYFSHIAIEDENTLGATELALVMTLGAMATIVAQIALIPRLKYSPRTLMVLGAGILAFSCFLLFMSPSLATFGIVQILQGIGFGFSRPGVSSGASLAVGTHLQGNVAGLVMAAAGSGIIISPIFGLVAYQNISQETPFIICIIVLALMGSYAYFQANTVYTETESEIEVDE